MAELLDQSGIVRTGSQLWLRVRGVSDAEAGASHRFRVVQRRQTRSNARVGFMLIAATSAFDGVVLVDRQPVKALPLIALNGAVVVLALIGFWLLGGALRRYPEPVAAVITLALTAATAATGLVLPALAIETVGYLLLLPGLIALIVPWRTQSHMRWLIGYAIIAVGYFALGPSAGLTADDRGDLIVVAVVACGASLAGHVLLRRAQVRNFSQLQNIQALRRRADADMTELARVHQALEETARTDPLTGAGNRVRLTEDLRAARARMNRLGHSHGIVMMDLDRFKLINDRFGHLGGDDVLRAVVACVQGTIRADDAIYRFGGEEFLVLLRVPDQEALEIAAERLRAAVATLGLAHPDNTGHGVVTVSLGAALVTPADLSSTDDDWFARADAALYLAKEGGRNQVTFAGPAAA